MQYLHVSSLHMLTWLLIQGRVPALVHPVAINLPELLCLGFDVQEMCLPAKGDQGHQCVSADTQVWAAGKNSTSSLLIIQEQSEIKMQPFFMGSRMRRFYYQYIVKNLNLFYSSS